MAELAFQKTDYSYAFFFKSALTLMKQYKDKKA